MSVALTARPSLPVFPNQQTFAESFGMSGPLHAKVTLESGYRHVRASMQGKPRRVGRRSN
jgi:hypothetical protein